MYESKIKNKKNNNKGKNYRINRLGNIYCTFDMDF